jgi:hypothetical protein
MHQGSFKKKNFFCECRALPGAARRGPDEHNLAPLQSLPLNLVPEDVYKIMVPSERAPQELSNEWSC